LDKEISIIPFRFKYLQALLEMHTANNYLEISKINMKTLPKIGYIALLNNHPVAAGFLRRLEGGYAQMDTLVSNPYFGSQIRHIAIDKVVKTLIEDAKSLNLHGIIGFTADSGVLNRAESLGFNVIQQTLIALPLKPK
jgi:hypothetical protein